MAALHAHGRLPRRRGADHRARRRLLPRGLERAPLPGRARRALLRKHRLRLRRGDRPGGARADAGAALLHELVVRAPEGDRARRGGRLARAGRPEPLLLRLRRLGGRRVGLEARAAVLPCPRRQARPGRRPRGRDAARRAGRRAAASEVQGDRAAGSPTTGRRSARSRSTASPRCGARSSRSSPRCATSTNTNRYHRPPEETEEEFTAYLLADLESTILLDGTGDRLPRAHGAGAERGRRVHPAGGLLGRRPRALRPLRHPALGRRGDHRASVGSGTGSAPSATTSGRTSSARRRGSRRPTRRSAP